jgi:hypothetical protein
MGPLRPDLRLIWHEKVYFSLAGLDLLLLSYPSLQYESWPILLLCLLGQGRVYWLMSKKACFAPAIKFCDGNQS